MFKFVSLSQIVPFLLLLTAAPLFASDAESLVVPELDAFAQEKVRKAFVAANPGHRWSEKVVRLHPKSGFVQHVMGWNGGTDPSEGEAVKIARDFILRNAAYLGLDAQNVDKLEYRYNASSLMGNVMARASKLPYPGYEDFKGWTYDAEILLKVRNNTVVTLMNKTNRLPFSIGRFNLNPSIDGEDMKIRNQLIGREMTFNDAAGKLHKAGWVGPQNLSVPQLVVHSQELDRGRGTRLELAWRYEVVLRGLSWSFFFSAHNGELVLVRQNFAS